MRLWTLHPRLLDARGLVALWREGLLAQKVLRGRTRGYRHHPQLDRFRNSPNPVGAVAAYLRFVHAEAVARGYRFDGRKIARSRFTGTLVETSGQLRFEWKHLQQKLAVRDQAQLRRITVGKVECHPLFRIRPGRVRRWEKQSVYSTARNRKKSGAS